MLAEFTFAFDKPVVCTAIHNGHELREYTKNNLGIDEASCLREEDPYTDFFAELCTNRIIANYSRFEVDVNRRRENSVYQTPNDAWGLNVRKNPMPESEIKKSLEMYDTFYARTKLMLDEMVRTFGKVYVFDFHSFNHNRLGDGQPFDDPDKNPEMIIGTHILEENQIPYIKTIHEEILKTEFEGRKIDCRINVKFPGGNFPRWIHRTYGDKVVCLAIEYKKIFMNEWTGELYLEKQEELRKIFENVLKMDMFQ